MNGLVTSILPGVFGLAAFIFVPGTYEPVLKQEKRPTLQEFIRTFLLRPALMLKSELMVWAGFPRNAMTDSTS